MSISDIFSSLPNACLLQAPLGPSPREGCLVAPLSEPVLTALRSLGHQCCGEACRNDLQCKVGLVSWFFWLGILKVGVGFFPTRSES